jgi:hypothetical protein
MKTGYKSHLYLLLRLLSCLAITIFLFITFSCNKASSVSEYPDQGKLLSENKTEITESAAAESLSDADLSDADKAKLKLEKELMEKANQSSDEESGSIIISGDAILPEDKCELLIISPGQFIKELTALKEHKNNTGITCKIVSLEDLYGSYKGKDEAEKVKYCLADYYKKSGLKYAMLVGDSDKFPVRYTKTEFYSEQTCNTAFFATDFYYASLYKESGDFDDWNSNANEYYGELQGNLTSGPINMDNVDLKPEIAVGRITASNSAEVRNVVKKIINYEKNGSSGSSFIKNVLLIGQGKELPGVCTTQEKIADEYLKDKNIIKLYYDPNSEPGETISEKEKLDRKLMEEQGVQIQEVCEKTEELNAANIEKIINQGTGFVGYLGHGTATDWYECFNVDNISKLTNFENTPVIVSGGCSNSVFSPSVGFISYKDIDGNILGSVYDGQVYNSPPPQPSCIQETDTDYFGEIFVNSEMGAVSFIGYAAMGQTDDYYAMYMPFFEFLSRDSNNLEGTILGDAINYSLEYYANNRISKLPEIIETPGEGYVETFQQIFVLTLFGDPSLRVY